MAEDPTQRPTSPRFVHHKPIGLLVPDYVCSRNFKHLHQLDDRTERMPYQLTVAETKHWRAQTCVHGVQGAGRDVRLTKDRTMDSVSATLLPNWTRASFVFDFESSDVFSMHRPA